MSEIIPLCVGCNKHPSEIEECVGCAKGEEMDVNDYVRELEGTYNRTNGHFLCNDCYIKAGMPAEKYPKRWVCP